MRMCSPQSIWCWKQNLTVSSYKLTLRSYTIYSSWLLINPIIELDNLQTSECDTISRSLKCNQLKLFPNWKRVLSALKIVLWKTKPSGRFNYTRLVINPTMKVRVLLAVGRASKMWIERFMRMQLTNIVTPPPQKKERERERPCFVHLGWVYTRLELADF